VRGGGDEESPKIGSLGLGDPASGVGAENGAVALDERQVRGEHGVGGREDLADRLSLRLTEDPAEDRRGVCVEVHRRSSRSSARSSAALPVTMIAGRGA